MTSGNGKLNPKKSMRKLLLILILVAPLALFSQVDAGKRHPWMVKTDLLGFRSHAFTLEGEVLLLWRISAFAQGGIIAGSQSGLWRGSGYQVRGGIKCYLVLSDATPMTGLAIRAEVVKMTWRSSSAWNYIHRNDLAGFVGASYTWNPISRLVVEPSVGIGIAEGYQWFDDPNLIGSPTGVPHTPWIQLAKYPTPYSVYDDVGDLVGMR